MLLLFSRHMDRTLVADPGWDRRFGEALGLPKVLRLLSHL